MTIMVHLRMHLFDWDLLRSEEFGFCPQTDLNFIRQMFCRFSLSSLHLSCWFIIFKLSSLIPASLTPHLPPLSLCLLIIVVNNIWSPVGDEALLEVRYESSDEVSETEAAVWTNVIVHRLWAPGTSLCHTFKSPNLQTSAHLLLWETVFVD